MWLWLLRTRRTCGCRHVARPGTIPGTVAAAVYDGTVALLIYPDSSDGTTYYSGSAIFGFGASADMSSAVGRTADFTGTGTLSATGFS